MFKKIMVASILVLCAVSMAFAAGDEKKTAKDLVDKAAAFTKSHGKPAALKEISNPTGQFVKGEIYVFAYDTKATMLAHPKNPKLIGKVLLEIPDIDGKLFRKEIMEKAASAGSGWVDYKYRNPVNNKVELKTTYFQKVNDIVICCGVYK